MNESTPRPVGASGAEDELADALSGAVEDTVSALLKATRARQTYVPGNPLIDQFHDELCQRLGALWNDLPHLSLTVDEGRLLWRDRAVYSKPLGPDNFAFRFFKDGIRQLALLPGTEDEELAEFLDILARTRQAHAEDLLAALWHRDFKTVRMDYVDPSEEEIAELPTPDRNAGAGTSLDDMAEIEEVLEAGNAEGKEPEEEEEEGGEFADLALGEPDLLYLKREIEAEWNRPLVHDVTLALLDQFEMRDQERRRQVVDILRELLPRLLADRDFSNVAMIVTELQLLANKTGENETQELVTSLLRDMSEAMAEMVSLVDTGEESPAAEELAALVGALQAEAIPTLVRAIPAVPDRSTRDRLTEALDRLVGANSSYVVDLLSAEDPMLAAEAARIVGRLGLTAAEQDLVELSKRPEDVTRQAAIEALAMLGSESGAQALTTALSDPGRDIRLAALSAVEAARPAGVEELLGEIIDSALATRDQGEQMAFLRVYASLAGGDAVHRLSKLLNGRKWWGGRHSSTLRAGAARALGLVGSTEARAALEKAANDRSAAVRSSVRVSLKVLDAGSDERLQATRYEEPPGDTHGDPLDLRTEIESDGSHGEEPR